MESVEEKVREYISGELALEGKKPDFDSDSPLLEQGIIDSMGLFRLIVFLEESLNIHIPEEDLRAENFQSVRHIVNYVNGQRELQK